MVIFNQSRVHKLVIFLAFTLFSFIFSSFSLAFLTFSLILSYFCFSLMIAFNSSWLTSMSINAWDIKVSMLSSLCLANIRILSYFFFLFLVILSSYFIIPVFREKTKVKLELAIPTGAPTTLAEKMIQIPLLVVLKTIKILSV